MSRFNVSNQQINNVVGNYIFPKLNKVYSNSEVNVLGSCNGDYLYWDTTTNSWTVGSQMVKIGCKAGQNDQGGSAVAIGSQAGQNSQGINSVAVGVNSGRNSQGLNATAIGPNAGSNTQGEDAVAIGNSAGQNTQGQNAIAIGSGSGQYTQGINTIAIGISSGQFVQGTNAIAIGIIAGCCTQGVDAVAIGSASGGISQGTNSIAIGTNSGNLGQGINAVAIGNSAGRNTQGQNALAIGHQAGVNNQHNNSIIINATGSALNSVTSSAFYASPVRTATTTGSLMIYDNTTKEITISSVNTSATNKTFVINHPLYSEKYLVHACLEGPEAGVYYRGESEIKNGKDVVIELPEYVYNLANEFTVQLNQIIEYTETFTHLASSRIENNKFKVYSSNGNVKFFWHVYGRRQNIEVEPLKKDVELKGDGPYKYL